MGIDIVGILNRRAALQLSGGVVCSSLFYGISPQAATGIETAAKPRIKIGQIGVGHAHATKRSVYRNSSDYEVVGIVEPDVELRKLAESQDTYRDLKWMTQEQLLNVAGLQAVLVETRVRDLLNVAEVCVASGKHIHLDKPAGESLSQFARILRLAASQKLMVQMGYMFRYNPAIVFLRKLLKDGWLGDVFEVHAVMSKDIDPETRRGLAEYPGGVMFELGGHISVSSVGRQTLLRFPSTHTKSTTNSRTICLQFLNILIPAQLSSRVPWRSVGSNVDTLPSAVPREQSTSSL